MRSRRVVVVQAAPLLFDHVETIRRFDALLGHGAYLDVSGHYVRPDLFQLAATAAAPRV